MRIHEWKRPLAFSLLLLLAAPARAQDVETLNNAILAYNAASHSLNPRPKYVEAAVGFYNVEENSTDQHSRYEAEYYLAESLYKIGLYYSAFFYYAQIVRAGPTHPYYFKAMDGVVNMVELLHDELIGPWLLNRSYSNVFADPRMNRFTRYKVHFFIGLVDFRANRFDEGERFLEAVPKESAYYARAQYLHGLILLRRNQVQQAIDTFKRIRALQQGDPVEYYDLPNVQDLSVLALARTYYGLGQKNPHYYEMSKQLYLSVPKYERTPEGVLPTHFNRYWEDALFEGAWADDMDNDPGGALGNLDALHSPALASTFQPESWIVQAIVYFENCLYQQSEAAINQYDKLYLPMENIIKPLLAANQASSYYFNLVADEKGVQGARLPYAVREYLGKNERFISFVTYVAQLDDEKRAIRENQDMAQSQLGRDLVDIISRQRNQLVEAAGKFARFRLQDVVDIINGFDGQAEIIRFEIKKAETRQLEAHVKLGHYLDQQALYRPAVPDDGTHVYWQFDQEWWPDELGYYRVTLKNACPAMPQE